MKTFDIASRTSAVYVHGDPISMANSFRGLSNLIAKKLNKDPTSGDLYVFFNRAKDYLKVLFFANDGFCIFSKKLPRGVFNLEGIEGEGMGSLSLQEMGALVNQALLPSSRVINMKRAA